MHIQDIFRQHPTTFSFEFFPPKTDEASDELFQHHRQLAGTAAVVRVGHLRGRRLDPRAHARPRRPHRERDEPDRRVAPDLRLPHRATRLAAILDRYADAASRTSWPWAATRRKNLADYDRSKDAFRYAGDLVEFIRSRDERAGPARLRHRRRRLPRRAPEHARTGSRRWTT